MKTFSGIETDGTYMFYQDKYTKFWIVETSNRIIHFYTREEAVEYLNGVKHLVATCTYFPN